MLLRTGAVLGLLTPLLLWGCSSPEAPASGAVAPAATATAAASNSVAAPTATTISSGALSLTLVPSRPTVLEDLEALVSGVTGKVEFRWEKNGVVLPGQTGSRLAAGYVARGDRVAVVAASAEGEVRAEVLIVNSPPRIEQVRLKEPRVYRGADLAVEVKGVDLDGDSLNYRFHWQVNGEELHWEQGPALPGDKFRRGDKVVLRVTPNDGHEDGQVFQGVEMVIPNGPPKFISEPPKQFQGQSYQYQLRVDDPDGDPISYSLETAPKGMEIDPKSGLLSWTFAASDSGEHRIRIVAKDPEGLGAYQEYSLGLTVPQ